MKPQQENPHNDLLDPDAFAARTMQAFGIATCSECSLDFASYRITDVVLNGRMEPVCDECLDELRIGDAS